MFVTLLAFKTLYSRVYFHVIVEMTGRLETFPTFLAFVVPDFRVASHVLNEMAL